MISSVASYHLLDGLAGLRQLGVGILRNSNDVRLHDLQGKAGSEDGISMVVLFVGLHLRIRMDPLSSTAPSDLLKTGSDRYTASLSTCLTECYDIPPGPCYDELRDPAASLGPCQFLEYEAHPAA